MSKFEETQKTVKDHRPVFMSKIFKNAIPNQFLYNSYLYNGSIYGTSDDEKRLLQSRRRTGECLDSLNKREEQVDECLEIIEEQGKVIKEGYSVLEERRDAMKGQRVKIGFLQAKSNFLDNTLKNEQGKNRKLNEEITVLKKEVAASRKQHCLDVDLINSKIQHIKDLEKINQDQQVKINELTKAAEDLKKSAEEHKKNVEELKKSVEKAEKNAEEHRKSSERNERAAKEHNEAAKRAERQVEAYKREAYDFKKIIQEKDKKYDILCGKFVGALALIEANKDKFEAPVND